MTVVELEEHHLLALDLQPRQAALGVQLGDPRHRADLLQFEGYAGIQEGRVVCTAGAIPESPGRALVWALLAGRLPMVAVHRAVLRWIEAQDIRRMETWVQVGHRAGERWAEMLGFEREGCMRAFLPDGADAWLYARVRWATRSA